MAQNTSHAVMAQRVEAHDSLDDFPTPPWGTRALIHYILHRQLLQDTDKMSVWEPACNRGYMARPLAEQFQTVYQSDVSQYIPGTIQHDFLLPFVPDGFCPNWIITNPPFRLGSQFIERAMQIATNGVAMLVRTAFLESAERYRELYQKTPPTIIAQFVERLPMVKGRIDKKASTATAYCWLVWRKGPVGWRPVPGESNFVWIPPCRSTFEKMTDY